MNAPWITVYETAHYLAGAFRFLTDEEQAEIVTQVARDPLSGVLVPGTGGLRKLRIAVAGRGKRGGGRVIYFFHDEAMPLFLLAAFAKNDRADLSARERADLARLCEALVKAYRR